MKKKIFNFAAILMMALCSLSIFNNTYADNATAGEGGHIYSTTVMDKAILSGVYKCYIDGKVNEGLAVNFGGSENDLNHMFSDQFDNALGNSNTGEKYIKLPAGLTNIEDNDVSCKQLFAGYADGSQSFSGILGATGNGSVKNGDLSNDRVYSWPNPELDDTFIRGMGYMRTNESSGNDCVYFEYTRDSDTRTYESEALCYNKTKNRVYIPYMQSHNNLPTFEFVNGFDTSSQNYAFYETYTTISVSCGGNLTTLPSSISYHDGKIDQSFIEKLEDAVYGTCYTVEGGFTLAAKEAKRLSDARTKDNDVVYNPMYFVLNSSAENAANTAISFLSNGWYKDLDAIRFTTKEKIDYYYTVIMSNYSNTPTYDCNERGIIANDMVEIKLDPNTGSYPLDEGTVCGISLDGAKSKNIISKIDDNGLYDSGSTTLSVEGAIVELNKAIDEYKNENPGADKEQAGTINPDPSTTVTDPDRGEATADVCYSTAGPLGWLACPVLKAVANNAVAVYSWVADEFLNIDANFFDTSKETYKAWQTIVGIANIIMVIFFLVIIFSQLTGVGIDNYGIKKSLPKIITAAILINISFIICQLMVEISNILGDALNSMFTNWASNISLPMGLSNVSNTSAGLFTALTEIITGGILGIGVSSALGAGLTIVGADSIGLGIAQVSSSIIIPALCAVIAAIIAVFFFFVMLGMRKACVIILVVISPLAFVCYMLPNTKSLFTKWWKGLKGLLLLYPICGLMIGGGYFVSRLILSTSQNYFVCFTAMMLMVVPFFFIPKLLTSSFSALSNVGAMVSGFGKNFGRRMSKGTRDTSGRLGGAIKGTDRFKDWQERSAEKRTAGIVNRLRNKQKNGELSKYQTRKLAKYQSAANESYAKNLSREAVANEMHQEAVKANLDEKFADDSIKSAMSLYRNGGQYDINDVKGTGDRSMNAAYVAALADYNGNKSSDNLAKIKALQNILSGTEDGRNIIQRNLSQAAMSGNADAVDTAKAAASHLLSEHGGTYKAANRGLHNMITGMATGDVVDAANAYGVDGGSLQTLGSYDAASFAAADDAAIENAVKAYNNIMSKSNKTNDEIEFCNRLNSIADEIGAPGSNIHAKGKVKDRLKKMNRNNSSGPQVDPRRETEGDWGSYGDGADGMGD